MEEKKIILVDDKDNEIGKGEKMKVHKEGKLHRAFSIFIFNSKKELLIQKRAINKYHNGGLWSNSCCSHPNYGESLGKATHRRLKEEMGFDCNLVKMSSFIYRKKFENGLIEHEYDHIFVGEYEKEPVPNLEEVEDWRWINLEDLKNDILINSDNYTFWFKKILDKNIF
ncbi:isopentenyl-diphosphate Delta-isomerase [Patescibacteria group bacterium]|nr:isopentenyl-diphosphate Delta-isomerase [Patescibacteria group bacterium]